MMHFTNKLLLLIVLTSVEQKVLGSEIIHGVKAQKNKLLYMASVQNDGEHICGGFLVSKDYVVTAAHCDTRIRHMTVVLGTHDIERVNEEMRYEVQKCKHPSFVKISSGNDIMLLKLNRKAKLSKTLKTIKLPSQDKSTKTNTKCLVAGWGLNETGGGTVNELQVVDVSTIDLKVCQREWKPFTLPANIICAGGYGTDKGACQGDSGGPLVCNGKPVGILSFNNRNKCTYPDLPNVYTEISKFLPWIKKVLKKKSCKI
ncbi:granzyme B-like [Polymixia lowei]